MANNFFTLDPLRKVLGVYAPPQSTPELPEQYSTTESTRSDTFEGFPLSTHPKSLPDNLPAYRGDEKRGGLETFPQARFDARTPLTQDARWWHGTQNNGKQTPATQEVRDMYAFARITGAAHKMGLPTVTPDQFAAMVLKEGRPDAGFNSFIPQAAPDVAFRKKLDQFNIPEWQKNFLGMVNYAQRVSQAKKIPFEAVWNGLGTAYNGKTGFDYARAMRAHKYAVTHPKNREFRQFVQNAYREGIQHGFPLVKNKQRDTDYYFKSDPKYEYHTPDGRLRKPPTISDVGNAIRNWFTK